MNSALEILQKYWKYDTFRHPQDEIVEANLQGKNVLALLPTGAGKSICYQVPALVREGVCIVISPLIALMKDQVQQLKRRGVNASAIISGMTEFEIDRILNQCANGHTKLLYIAPERLSSNRFIIGLKTLPVSMLAVDEAHCISQWGFEFRPSYRNIASIKEMFPKIPIMALTASATPEVQEDIIETLQLGRDVDVYTASFERPNISFAVRKDTSKPEKLLEILQKVPGTAIVYTTNRKKTEEIAQYLYRNGISATFYHAGLSADERNRRQEAWINDQYRVVCCTNAFGMGIDKPNVRLVVHVDIPESLEAYYQEAGRAGRDGKKSYAVLLYNEKDKEKLYTDLENKFPDFEFVKLVYNALYNYLNIAFGGGKGHSFEFNIVDFSKKYKWEVLQVYNSLKLLEQAGYLTLGEAFALPSRIQIAIDRMDLYKFQVANLNYDGLIKAILRTYEGVQSGFVKVNEAYLAQKVMMPPLDCIRMLRELRQRGVIHYVQSTDKPRINFLEERVKEDNLRLDFEFISFMKEQISSRIEGILDYAEAHEDTCRQVIMRYYFGELHAENCGVCDHCLKMKQLQSVDTQELSRRLKRMILEFGEEGMPIQELYHKLSNTLKDQYLEVMRYLLDEGQLSWVDEEQQYIKVEH